MKIINDYNACECVRSVLSTLSEENQTQKNPSLQELLSHILGVLDDLQPKILSVQGLPGFVLTTNIDPWLKAPLDCNFGTRAVAIDQICQLQPDNSQVCHDIDFAQLSLWDEAPHPDE
ncbi:MAG: hypothetical protein KDJ29_05080 [Hyphomicrobiales bacterium]|nr:hypothetical protein [Hyphomicrobiales bacterium]